MGKDIISPAVVFIAPFCGALICAAVYRKKWNLNIHFNTFFTILGGCFEFALVCILLHKTFGRKNTEKQLKENPGIIESIQVQYWKIIAAILVQFVSIWVIYIDMCNSLLKYGISGNFRVIMYYYREYHMFSDKQVGLSSLGTNLRILSIGIIYIWIYVICNNIVCRVRSKNFVLLFVSIILGVINCVMLGARGEAIQVFIASIMIFMFLERRYNGWSLHIGLKHYVLIALFLFIMMFCFKASGDLLGRNSVVDYNTSIIDELAKYLGAEIKNLDIYLENPFKVNEMKGSQTFGVILGWISKKFNFGWNTRIILPFQKINGISLGNVYTVFFAYLVDFGYIGVVFITMLFASIVQLSYEYMCVESRKEKINFNIILNSFFLFLIAFSFFGERFFASVFNIVFLKYLIVWKFMIWFVTRLK